MVPSLPDSDCNFEPQGVKRRSSVRVCRLLCLLSSKAHNRRVKCWEIMADNLLFRSFAGSRYFQGGNPPPNDVIFFGLRPLLMRTTTGLGGRAPGIAQPCRVMPLGLLARNRQRFRPGLLVHYSTL